MNYKIKTWKSSWKQTRKAGLTDILRDEGGPRITNRQAAVIYVLSGMVLMVLLVRIYQTIEWWL